ncbi:MAG: diguanylate cyclase [bacterium]
MSGRIGYLGEPGDYENTIYTHLSNLGFEFAAFREMAELFNLAPGEVPDLVIVNGVQSSENFASAYYALRENEATTRLPVLYLADDIMFPDDTEDDAGLFDYVSVPCFPEEILLRIYGQLRLARLRKELEDKNKSLSAVVTQLREKNDEIQNLLNETKELNLKLAELARTDELTGLFNKRYLIERLDSEFSRASRYGYPIGFLMADIDGYKNVNDTFGHPVGDRTLKLVASTIMKALRTDDTVTRYGGDEIAIILPYSGADSCFKAAERLRLSVEESTRASGGLPMPVTISVGGASTEGAKFESPDELVKRSDEMLYEAKHAGKNRVKIYKPAE